MEDAYRLSLSIYYPIHYVLVFSMQFFLLFIMTRNTPKALQGLRFYMVKSCFVKMVVTNLIFFAQFRTINNNYSIAIVCYGPSSYFSDTVCFHSFNAIQIGLAEVTLSLAHTVYYKYRNALNLSKKQSYFSILIQASVTLLPLIALAVTMTISSSNFPSIRAETQAEHPEYRITQDTVLAGYNNMRDPVNVAALTIIGLVAYGTTIFTFVCKHKIEQSFEERSEHLSEHTKKSARTFIWTLTAQSLVPAVCNIPTITLFIYKQYTGFGRSLIICEYLWPVVMSIPTTVSPPMALYFILPYRKAVASLFCNKKTEDRSSQNPSV